LLYKEDERETALVDGNFYGKQVKLDAAEKNQQIYLIIMNLVLIVVNI